MTSIPVVDIFAGAGGLGEGFSLFMNPSSGERAFRIALSAEMDGHAVKTLRTRAFYRQFERPQRVPDSYYDYLAGTAPTPWTAQTLGEWEAAEREALQLELGNAQHDAELHSRIRAISSRTKKWILVGGPPCQAYSLIGRARNKGIKGYVAESDGRHFLYEHYLDILSEFQPTAFVLENVEGMLTSKIDGRSLFDEIKGRLERPGGPRGPRYTLHPMIRSSSAKPERREFLVQGETLGLPQTRHRVILIGVLDSKLRRFPPDLDGGGAFTVRDMIADLPRLRSKLTDAEVVSWRKTSQEILAAAAEHAAELAPDVAKYLLKLSKSRRGADYDETGQKFDRRVSEASKLPRHLASYMTDKRLGGFVNHEARGHMKQDLMRYAYASAFAHIRNRSPRGAAEFPEGLHPEHKNWKESKKFVDRFKVQRFDLPSSTIVSHLAKDGHYFIHPDPSQIRSLTVREAARLQTFPDNFIFEGPAGSQRKQVGNAVPPWLGYKIAKVVHHMIK